MKLILKTRTFSRWLRKTLLTDAALLKAIDEMERGLVDADLGGNVYKKRVALPGRGKSGSARTLIATQWENRWIFLFGFEKNDRENITPAELAYLQNIAQDLLQCPEESILSGIERRELEEIRHD
ncbi:hypothetical protein HMPREF1022_00361 [Desulfovibrio sp. 6_1_46AFAA]|uniref:type II toxin-antitoxin system RelE/ParE family toxin n=1 Tax=Desulfovibrio sp. 6_1_46AFAA TaxID=665942 RepID=UPI0002237163|nr:type II toxin-antitoxin system RelE/ParE family toxin [Desulfovibrio sp. 6_1_46AFAA]EGW52593.1 hypothetical protein HMPREF1022_00361 [Desulfovibrio sp. 6_1_46AFAA]